jgi:hypothetical protein
VAGICSPLRQPGPVRNWGDVSLFVAKWEGLTIVWGQGHDDANPSRLHALPRQLRGGCGGEARMAPQHASFIPAVTYDVDVFDGEAGITLPLELEGGLHVARAFLVELSWLSFLG